VYHGTCGIVLNDRRAGAVSFNRGASEWAIELRFDLIPPFSHEKRSIQYRFLGKVIL